MLRVDTTDEKSMQNTWTLTLAETQISTTVVCWIGRSLQNMGNWSVEKCSMNPDSKIHGANMGPTWVLSGPDGPHAVPMNIAFGESNGLVSIYWNSTIQYKEADLPVSELLYLENGRCVECGTIFIHIRHFHF